MVKVMIVTKIMIDYVNINHQKFEKKKFYMQQKSILKHFDFFEIFNFNFIYVAK